MQKIIEGHLYDTDLAKEVADNTKWLEPPESPTGDRCKFAEGRLSKISGCPLTQTKPETDDAEDL